MRWARSLWCVLVAMLMVAAVTAAGKDLFRRYDILEVEDFQNIDAIGENGGLRPPQVVLDAARRDLVQQVVGLRLFRQVGGHVDDRAKGGNSGTLRLTGEVVHFDAKVNKGGGKGTLTLNIQIKDKSDETLLFEGPVKAKISSWVNRPHSEVTASEIGKKVAEIIKNNW